MFTLEAELRVEGLKGYIKEIYKTTRTSVLLIGLPGIGKTTAVREASQELAKELGKTFVEYDEPRAEEIIQNPDRYFVFVDLNPTHLEPADLIGIPKMVNGRTSYIPLSWAFVLSRASGILFIDEITNVQRPDVLSATFRIVQERRCGFTKFTSETMIVSAGNAPEHSAIANLLPAPLVNRFVACRVQPPTVEGWVGWMDKNHPDWDKRVLAHLTHFAEDFIKIPSETETLTNFPTPRSWTAVANLIPKIDSSLWLQTAIGLLGEEVGLRYHSLLKTEIPNIEELIEKPEKFNNLDLQQKYLASVFLGSFLAKTEKVKVAIPLLEAMSKTQQDFVVLAILSSGEKKSDIALGLSRLSATISRILLELSQLRLSWETKKH